MFLWETERKHFELEWARGMKIYIVLFFLIRVNADIFNKFIRQMRDDRSYLLHCQSHQARGPKVTSSCSQSPSDVFKHCRWCEINQITGCLHDADWKIPPRWHRRRCGQWHTVPTMSHCTETRESTATIWLEPHRRSFEAAPLSGCLCDFGGCRPLVEQRASIKSRKDQHQCCHSRGGEARTQYYTSNNGPLTGDGCTIKRVELEPWGQLSLYLSPTLTAGTFWNFCLTFHTKPDDKVAPVLCHKATL